jgi:hypothetical protein
MQVSHRHELVFRLFTIDAARRNEPTPIKEDIISTYYPKLTTMVQNIIANNDWAIEAVENICKDIANEDIEMENTSNFINMTYFIFINTTIKHKEQIFHGSLSQFKLKYNTISLCDGLLVTLGLLGGGLHHLYLITTGDAAPDYHLLVYILLLDLPLVFKTQLAEYRPKIYNKFELQNDPSLGIIRGLGIQDIEDLAFYLSMIPAFQELYYSFQG